MSLPERISRTVVHADKWLAHSVDSVRLPNGNVLDAYHVIEFPHDSVGAVVVNKEGSVLLVKAVRYPTQSLEWELPAGSIEPGELPQDAIKREVFEETGYVIGTCELLCTFQPMNDLTPKRIKVFVAQLEGGDGRADGDEVTEARWFTKAELQRMIAFNEINDGLTMIGLLRWFWEATKETEAS